MRKILITQSVKSILLIILFCKIFLFSHEELIACDAPYTQQVATVIYPNNNCEYFIIYCCWWDSYNNTLRVYFKEVWHRSNCLIHPNDWNEFRNWMMTQMYNDAISKCAPSLPPCDPLPPPTVTVTIPTCYYYENALVVKFPGDDPIWMLKLKNCYLSGKCEERLIVCIDYSKNPAEIKTLLDECEVIEQPICGFEVPDLPPSGKSWEEAWFTDCFARPCCP